MIIISNSLFYLKHSLDYIVYIRQIFKVVLYVNFIFLYLKEQWSILIVSETNILKNLSSNGLIILNIIYCFLICITDSNFNHKQFILVTSFIIVFHPTICTALFYIFNLKYLFLWKVKNGYQLYAVNNNPENLSTIKMKFNNDAYVSHSMNVIKI